MIWIDLNYWQSWDYLNHNWFSVKKKSHQQYRSLEYLLPTTNKQMHEKDGEDPKCSALFHCFSSALQCLTPLLYLTHCWGIPAFNLELLPCNLLEGSPARTIWQLEELEFASSAGNRTGFQPFWDFGWQEYCWKYWKCAIELWLPITPSPWFNRRYRGNSFLVETGHPGKEDGKM